MRCELCGDVVDVQVYKQSGDEHPQSTLCEKCENAPKSWRMAAYCAQD